MTVLPQGSGDGSIFNRSRSWLLRLLRARSRPSPAAEDATFSARLGQQIQGPEGIYNKCNFDVLFGKGRVHSPEDCWIARVPIAFTYSRAEHEFSLPPALFLALLVHQNTVYTIRVSPHLDYLALEDAAALAEQISEKLKKSGWGRVTIEDQSYTDYLNGLSPDPTIRAIADRLLSELSKAPPAIESLPDNDARRNRLDEYFREPETPENHSVCYLRWSAESEAAEVTIERAYRGRFTGHRGDRFIVSLDMVDEQLEHRLRGEGS
jgi:hypothetical protein